MDSNDTLQQTPQQSPSSKDQLLPETNKKISSMAEAFKNAMKPADQQTPPAQQQQPQSRQQAPQQQNQQTPPAQSKPNDQTPPSSDDDSTDSNGKPVSRSAADFKLIKSERDAAKQQVAELLSKLSSYEEMEGFKEKYDSLKSEYDQISETLTVTNLERHPKFKEQYVKPIETQIERAKAYVPEGSREQLAKILRMPMGDARANALDELVGDLPMSRQAYLQNVVNRIDEISYERDQRLAEAKASYEKMVEEENFLSETKTAERNKALEKSFNTMLKEAQEQIGIYQLREGDEEWNNGVRERVALAKKILMEQNTFEDAATAALWAASGGALVEQNAALVEHNRRLTAELEALKGAEPGAGGGGAAPQTQSGHRPAGSTFSDRVMGELQTMGVNVRRR